MWGKILGGLFGAAIAKIPGLVIGIAVGHWFDRSMGKSFESAGGFAGLGRNDAEQQGLFTFSTFAVMGHLAKADGVVTQAHIDRALGFMQQLGLSARQQREAQAAFRDGKAVNFPLRAQVNEFYYCYRRRPDVLQLFLEIQLSIACTGGKMVAGQRELLWQIAEILQIPRATLEQLLRAYQARSGSQPTEHTSTEQRLAAAYQVLGCDSTVTDLQLKRAYRKLMAQHHPDKLMSQGVPAAMLDIAKRRSQDIQAAYELIKQHRAKNH